MTSSPDPRPRRIALALALAFAALYAATWNGLYLHDGPMFLRAVEDGHWWHVHVAYLPLAQVLALGLGWIPGVDGARCLAALAVGSGAACVGLSALLAGRVARDWRVAAAAGVLVGLAPVVWSASGMVEIHVFGGAGACAAAWLAHRLAWPPWARMLVVVPLAMAAHLTAVLLVPLLLAIALERGPARATRRDVALALAAAGACVLGMHALGARLPPQPEALGGALPALLDQALHLALRPSVLLSRITGEVARPWLALAAGPLLALVQGGALGRWTRLAAAGTGALGALLVATYMPLAGQYGLVLCPALVLGLVQAMTALPAGAPRAKLAWAAGLLSLALAPAQRSRLIADPDRDWASAIAPSLGDDATVLCLGRARQLRVLELTPAQAVNFQGAGDAGTENLEQAIDLALAKAERAGRVVYLDPQILKRGPSLPPLAPVVAALRRELSLRPLKDGVPLVRVLPGDG